MVRFVLHLLLFNFVMHCIISTVVVAFEINLSYLILCMCSVTYTSATVTPIAVKFCIMVHIGPGHKVSPLGGGSSKGFPKSKILAV